MDLLSAIREAVGPHVQVILDGGVQRGTDVVKAPALGADAVGVGKPYLYGLCAGGEAGVHRALSMLRTETERAMGLLGVGTVSELKARGPDLVQWRLASVRDYPDPSAVARGYGGGFI